MAGKAGHGGKRVGAGRRRSPTKAEVKTVREMAQPHGQKAMDKLVELMGGESEAIQLKASELLLSYAYGRPTQMVDVKADVQMSGPELPVQWFTIEGKPIDNKPNDGDSGDVGS